MRVTTNIPSLLTSYSSRDPNGALRRSLGRMADESNSQETLSFAAELALSVEALTDPDASNQTSSESLVTDTEMAGGLTRFTRRIGTSHIIKTI